MAISDFHVTPRQRRNNFGVMMIIRPFRWGFSFEHTPSVCTLAANIGPLRFVVSY